MPNRNKLTWPFSPEILDAMPEALAELFRELEETLLKEIVDRLKAVGQMNEVTVQAIRQLRAQGIPLNEITDAIQKATGLGRKELDALLDDVVARNQAYYSRLIDLADVTAPEALVSEEDIIAIRRQTWGAYENITGSMGFLLSRSGRLEFLPPAKAYEHCLDSALMQVQYGNISYNQAISNAVRELADGGLKTAYYEPRKPGKKAHVDHVDVAVRRAVMTGVTQINAQYSIQSMEYLGAEYVEVSAHAGARDISGPMGWEAHTEWQGRVFYWAKAGEADPMGKYNDFLQSTGYNADGTGLCGYNCRHNFHPFIPGVMEPTYTEAQLKNIDNPPFTYEGKEYTEYAATQEMRRIEATIRKWKRRLAGAVTEADETTAKTRIARLNQKYIEFSHVAGLRMQKERANAYVPGGTK